MTSPLQSSINGENSAMTDPSTKHAASVMAAGLATAAMAGSAKAAEAEDKFLAGIRSDDEDENYAAWSTADQVDPSVVPALAELLTSKKLNVRKGAEEALKNIVHSVGKVINASGLGANTGRPDDPGRMDERQAVVMQLHSVISGKGSETAKTTALRHLSLIGTTDDVGRIAPLLHDAQLGEEAAFCLERIPGKASEEAFLAALPAAADDFKPRILAALGHRQADEAAGAAIEAMRSSDSNLAMAGMKAWARIGTSGGMDVTFPATDSLSEWQMTEFDDSQLRYADAQLERGNAEEAQAIYMEALERDEEHLQCAAIIGLANVASAEAAAAIYPKLSSDDNTVRLTARQAWARLAAGDDS